ncbi:MAG: DUF4124 domain-containing protein [Desulfobacteraceae bacterium]|nr:DUF4124 domain-containing protein [Desulfobacteraceae bacterium]
MRLISVFVLILGLVFAAQGHAELYQYTDSDGVTHFTDDSSEVPEKYRQDMESRPEIESMPVQGQDGKDSDFDKKKAPDESGAEKVSGDEKKAADLTEKAESLSAKHKELTKEYEQIKEKREKMVNNPPEESASDEQKYEYSQKVRELNKRIESYKEKAEAYEKKVESFNAEASEQAAE